jgi:hypothetical protein
MLKFLSAAVMVAVGLLCLPDQAEAGWRRQQRWHNRHPGFGFQYSNPNFGFQFGWGQPVIQRPPVVAVPPIGFIPPQPPVFVQPQPPIGGIPPSRPPIWW